MECFTRVSAALAMTIAVAACQPVAKQRIDWDINTWTHDCFGDRTVSCINRKVKINLRIIDYTITQIKDSNVAEKEAGRPSLDEGQLEAGLAAIDSVMVKAAKNQRPGLFARWFLGSAQHWDVPRYFTTEFVTQETILKVFAAAVLDYNRQHGIRDNTGIPVTPATQQAASASPAAPDNTPVACAEGAGCQDDAPCSDASCTPSQMTPPADAVEAVTPVDPAVASACGSGESLLFSCTTTNRKQVLLCDAGDALYYSFGRPEQAPELSLKIDRLDASTSQWEGIGSSISYSIDIPNANTVYNVFWSVDRMTDEHPVEAGVNVRINERHVATVACQPETVQQALEGVDLKPST